MDTFAQDIRYAVRTLARAPLVTGLAILCLALGIGANATMFSVMHSTLVQPLPFHEPDRLVDLWSVRPAAGDDRSTTSLPRLPRLAAADHAPSTRWRPSSRAA